MMTPMGEMLSNHEQGAIAAQTEPDDREEAAHEIERPEDAQNAALSSFPEPHPRDAIELWPFRPGVEPKEHPAIKGAGMWAVWDGVNVLAIELANGAEIRSLYFPIVPPQLVSVLSGAGGGGIPIVPALQPIGTVPIPPGNRNITLKAAAKFATPIPIYATSDAFDPTPNESITVALQNATINVSGNINANITNATLITNVTNTVSQIGTSDYPQGSTPFQTNTAANIAAAGAIVQFSPAVALPFGAHLYLTHLILQSPGLDAQCCVGVLDIGTWDGITFTALESFTVAESFDWTFSHPIKSSNIIANGLTLAFRWTPTDTQIGVMFMSMTAQGYLL